MQQPCTIQPCGKRRKIIIITAFRIFIILMKGGVRRRRGVYAEL